MIENPSKGQVTQTRLLEALEPRTARMRDKVRGRGAFVLIFPVLLAAVTGGHIGQTEEGLKSNAVHLLLYCYMFLY